MKQKEAPAPKKGPKQGVPGPGTRPGHHDVARLVHELETHRVELEAQNEELLAARSESERLVDRYTELFDFAPIGYVILDVNGKICQSNLNGARMLGMPRPELVGLSFASFVGEGDRAKLSRLLGQAFVAHGQERTSDECELTLYVTGGEPIEVRVTDAALPGEPSKVLVALVDVTAAKRAERLLRDESRRKDDFLAALSHELRNPLGPIRTGAAILRRLEPLEDEARDAVGVIERQTGHLAHIVEDLLDVSRITRSKIHLQREVLDAREVMARTTDDYRAAFEEAEVALDCAGGGEPLWVEADRTRLAQILGNLLGNALKFTTQGGAVRVSGRVVEGQVGMVVRDDGAGIEPELREHLFEPFVQGPQNLARTGGGLGLGLATVKGLVELHGGSVAVASDGAGRGAVFCVRLPRVPAPAMAASSQPSMAHNVKRHVLIVEDNPDAAETLQYLLSLDGHDVRVAHDGAAGIELARRFPPDIVLCDIGLPVMDGYAVARAMRADAALRDVTLFALSGYAADRDRQQALDAGFDGHLAKPPDLEEIDRILTGPLRARTHAGR